MNMNNIIYYTFLAGWCAEAAGARLEFRKTRYDEKQANDALHMVGLNTSGVKLGQITDDSEMEMCLMSALIACRNEEYFPLEAISEEYIKLYKSEPFDIGQTTTYALLDANNASDMLTNSHEYNEHSESNGSLMRCIPLAVFGMNKNTETIMNMAELENELTHPNKLVSEITGIYCVIISDMLVKQTNNQEINIDGIISSVSKLITNKHIYDWFHIGRKLTNLKEYDCIKNEGHVKHAFIFVIYFLHNIKKYNYETAISEVLQCGGDTDTNAKIVGNLFGAYYGDCVPSYMSHNVLNFDCTDINNDFFKRPLIYGVKYAIQLINKFNMDFYNI